jgi:thioredoxin reductase (NADPH)
MYDVVIVGGASAGLAAAIYTSRQGLKTLLLTKDIGGQAILTSHIENYPGFDTIGGPELMEKFQQQATNFGTEFRYEEVKTINRIGGGGGNGSDKTTSFNDTDINSSWFTVKTSTEEEYECLSIILAFGKTPKDLDVPGEEKLVGKGVSYCAVCDAPLSRDKVSAVVGWGDPAIDAVLMLCTITSKVYFIFRSSQLVGNDQFLNRCSKLNNVELVPNSIVTEILGTKKVEGITVQDKKSGQTKNIAIDSIFVELGFTAKTDFVKDLVNVNQAGEIIVIDKNQATSQPGIFAAGDVTDTPFKQAITSAGDGAKAGLAAYNYVQRIRGRPALKSDWKVKLK